MIYTKSTKRKGVIKMKEKLKKVGCVAVIYVCVVAVTMIASYRIEKLENKTELDNPDIVVVFNS